MNPTSLIPTPDTLGAPWGWFQFFLMLTFPLHLLAMNAMIGTALTALLCHFRAARPYRELAHELAKALPLLIAFTVNLGVAPLLFVQVLYGHMIYSSSVIMGIFWLGILPVLLIAYYAAYLYDFKFSKLGGTAPIIILLIFLLLLSIGFIFTNNMTLMLLPSQWDRWFTTPNGSLLNLAEPTLFPRYLHMMTGSLAVGGLFVALYAKLMLKQSGELGEAGISLGMKLFSWLTLAQVVMGTWFLLALPHDIMMRFLGRDGVTTTLFVIGLALVVVVLYAGFKQKVFLAMGTIIPLVYVMSFMRDSVRTGYLAPLGVDPAKMVLKLQWSPLVFFLVTLVLGVITIAWMVSKLPSRTSNRYR